MRTRQVSVAVTSACLVLGLSMAWARTEPQPRPAEQKRTPSLPQKPQNRPHGEPLSVDPATITVDDGDTVVIRWPDGDVETVRILGIDTPETRHEEHGIPLDQPLGPEARAFAQGAFTTATDVKLVRAAVLDPYDRTLGYLILNGKNYSVLVIRARLSDETVSHYGDNGLPELAAEVTTANRSRGPLAFEPPHVFRKRMRELSDWKKNSTGKPDR